VTKKGRGNRDENNTEKPGMKTKSVGHKVEANPCQKPEKRGKEGGGM